MSQPKPMTDLNAADWRWVGSVVGVAVTVVVLLVIWAVKSCS